MTRTITREAFAADHYVEEMARWMAGRFDRASGWTHTWVNRKNGERSCFSGLHDAFLQYRWNDRSWDDNKQTLDGLRCRLREAVVRGDVESVVAACEDVLKWGGVAARNVRYLHCRRPVLIAALRHVQAVLSRNRTPSKRDLCIDPGATAPECRMPECRMNAGFVKIYSLLCDRCVIYDGRVGAALGLLVRQFCEAAERAAVPANLRFAYGSPKETPGAKCPKVRNPGRGGLRFPRLRPDSRFHTEQVLRANWLLRRALEINPHAFSAGEEGFHELAAGLFMVGYDLPDAFSAGYAVA